MRLRFGVPIKSNHKSLDVYQPVFFAIPFIENTERETTKQEPSQAFSLHTSLFVHKHATCPFLPKKFRVSATKPSTSTLLDNEDESEWDDTSTSDNEWDTSPNPSLKNKYSSNIAKSTSLSTFPEPLFPTTLSYHLPVIDQRSFDLHPERLEWIHKFSNEPKNNHNRPLSPPLISLPTPVIPPACPLIPSFPSLMSSLHNLELPPLHITPSQSPLLPDALPLHDNLVKRRPRLDDFMTSVCTDILPTFREHTLSATSSVLNTIHPTSFPLKPLPVSISTHMQPIQSMILFLKPSKPPLPPPFVPATFLSSSEHTIRRPQLHHHSLPSLPFRSRTVPSSTTIALSHFPSPPFSIIPNPSVIFSSSPPHFHVDQATLFGQMIIPKVLPLQQNSHLPLLAQQELITEPSPSLGEKTRRFSSLDEDSSPVKIPSTESTKTTFETETESQELSNALKSVNTPHTSPITNDQEKQADFEMSLKQNVDLFMRLRMKSHLQPQTDSEQRSPSSQQTTIQHTTGRSEGKGKGWNQAALLTPTHLPEADFQRIPNNNRIQLDRQATRNDSTEAIHFEQSLRKEMFQTSLDMESQLNNSGNCTVSISGSTPLTHAVHTQLNHLRENAAFQLLAQPLFTKHLSAVKPHIEPSESTVISLSSATINDILTKLHSEWENDPTMKSLLSGTGNSTIARFKLSIPRKITGLLFVLKFASELEKIIREDGATAALMFLSSILSLSTTQVDASKLSMNPNAPTLPHLLPAMMSKGGVGGGVWEAVLDTLETTLRKERKKGFVGFDVTSFQSLEKFPLSSLHSSFSLILSFIVFLAKNSSKRPNLLITACSPHLTNDLGRTADHAALAYSSLEDVEKVKYISHIKDTPTPEGKSAALLVFRRKPDEAEKVYLSAGLKREAVKLNVRLFRWERALEIAKEAEGESGGESQVNLLEFHSFYLLLSVVKHEFTFRRLIFP
ncbi:hypothetical protein BLNAU_17394 [Blattamonas nauphoetae]|uniref:IFT80/172/WDR35 TPR domain-containing protein n=1 Tax=Blattamonas nauphoetae TaxID=2049346 RepID=A0ABQ9X8S0_9EUKA|nr:hypothetical protein BLNAU_17394 [Blattamonas nauphoetae]